jgi:hypothetical protein
MRGYSVDWWSVPRPSRFWNAGCRLLAVVMTEDELILIDLELSSADAVVGADQPLLEVAHGSIGQGHSGFHAYGVRQASSFAKSV